MTEQEMREKVIRRKVIRGLEHHLLDDDGYPNCNGCPYAPCSVRCHGDLVADALALLKAQEPVEPKIDVDELRCGNCGHKLEHQELLGENVLFHEQYSYCPQCGRAVKRE